MAQLEQFIFWITQIIWLFILANELNSDFLTVARNKRSYIKLFFPLSLILCLFFGIVLYLKGLLVFTYLSIYGLVSVIFLFQVFSFVILKTLHASIYSSKRVYVNIWFIYAVHFLSVYLLLYFWERFNYWSIPISFGFQIVGLVSVRGFYYLKEYKLQFKKKPALEESWKSFITSLNWHYLFFAVICVLPDIILYSSVQFVFFKKSNYSFIFYFLAALTNSRIPSLFFQDFLKYSDEKYNLILDRYEKKLSIFFLSTALLLHALFLFSKYLLFGYINYRLALFSILLCSVMTLFGSFVLRRFAQLRFYDLTFYSLTVSLCIYFSVYAFYLKRFYLAISILCICFFVLIYVMPRVFFHLKNKLHKVSNQDSFDFYKQKYPFLSVTSFRLDGVSQKHIYFINFLISNKSKIKVLYKNKNSLVQIIHNDKLVMKNLFPFMRDFSFIKPSDVSLLKNEAKLQKFLFFSFPELHFFKSKVKFAFKSEIIFMPIDLKLLFKRIFKGHKSSQKSYANQTPHQITTDWHRESVSSISINLKNQS